MRTANKLLALSALVITQGCYEALGRLEGLGGSCPQEQLVVTFPVTITRGAAVTSTLITKTMTPGGSLSQSQFNLLRQILVDGGTGSYNVTWTVPAFDANGGHIALRHSMPMATGETQQVGALFNGGEWSAQPATPPLPPAVSIHADNFLAASASGSITALNSVPLRLKVDVTTTNAAGETIRVTGEAGFTYQKVTTTCI
jgi:hypothetical protein